MRTAFLGNHASASDHSVARFSPSFDAPEESPGVWISHLPALQCPTGRGVLIGSGAVEDDFPVLRERRETLPKLAEGDGHIEPHFLECGLIVMAADEDRLAGLYVLISLLGTHSDSRHDHTSLL
jgi:hypothetical protein